MLPVRETYRNLRVSAAQFGRNFTESVFFSTLLLCVAGGVYPYMLCLLPVIPYLFHRRHVLDGKGLLAFVLAIAVFAIYYALLITLGWIENDILNWF